MAKAISRSPNLTTLKGGSARIERKPESPRKEALKERAASRVAEIIRTRGTPTPPKGRPRPCED